MRPEGFVCSIGHVVIVGLCGASTPTFLFHGVTTQINSHHPPPLPPQINQQIYYVYGQRKSGDVDKSYQMGFGGGAYPRNPHHRATSCDDQGAWASLDRGG